MPTIAPRDALRCLPHLFHIADLSIRFGWKPKVALRQNYIWMCEGQTQELGGQSNIFANLVIAKYPNWELALRMIMPTGVVIGIEILRREGWTTQIPYIPAVAVDATKRIRKVKHFEVIALPPKWFELMKRGIRNEDVALPHLAPAWALVDLILREGWCDCGLGPDDIYWEAVTPSDLIDWHEACTVLGLGNVPINPDAEHSSGNGRYHCSALNLK